MSDKYSDYVKNYNEKIVELLEKNEAPWQKPWGPGERGNVPCNATTGKPYTGSNSLYLGMQQAMNGYADDRWATFNQGKALDAFVRKGEKGTQLVKWIEIDESKDQQATSGDDKEKGRMAPVLFTVFNAEQFENFPPAPEQAKVSEHERHETCEQLIKDSGIQIKYGGNQAFYRPSSDTVHLPPKEQFTSADGLYATTLHEIGHATGHDSRLKRDLTGAFGSASYAKEELSVEIGSLMIAQRLGVGHDPGQHAAYCQSWIKLIKDDPKALMTACRNAERICEFLGVEKYENQATQKVELTAEQQAEQQAARAQAKDKAKGQEQEAPMVIPSPDTRPQPAMVHKREWTAESGMSM